MHINVNNKCHINLTPQLIRFVNIITVTTLLCKSMATVKSNVIPMHFNHFLHHEFHTNSIPFHHSVFHRCQIIDSDSRVLFNRQLTSTPRQVNVGLGLFTDVICSTVRGGTLLRNEPECVADELVQSAVWMCTSCGHRCYPGLLS